MSGIGSAGPTLGRLMSATTSVRPDQSTRTASHFGLAVMALAMGGFAIGTAEFVTMGLLPQIADGVGVAIPTAGHVISAYAVGVVVGAPVLAYFGARLPRRGLLLALMGAFVLGNVFSALAGSYGMLMLSRFLDRAAARRLLRRRLPGRREHGVPRAPRPCRRDGDARAVGGQRARRARRHLARPEPRLALGLLDGRPARPAHPRAGPPVRARLPGRPRRHRPPGALRVHQQPGLADPARRCHRLRRHVRRLHLHRADPHRGGRSVRGRGAGVPAGLRPRHGLRHLAGRRDGRLVGLRLAVHRCPRDGRGARRVRPRRRRTAGGPSPWSS